MIDRYMANTINPRGSVLGKEPRKYQEQDKHQGLEHGSRSKF